MPNVLHNAGPDYPPRAHPLSSLPGIPACMYTRKCIESEVILSSHTADFWLSLYLNFCSLCHHIPPPKRKGNYPMSVLDQMHTAMKEAKENSSRGAMLMLTTDGEQRRIRFLYDLDNGANNQAIVFLRHVVYDNAAKKYIVDAVCGAEVGQSCRYCTLAQHDKRYIARKSFF